VSAPPSRKLSFLKGRTDIYLFVFAETMSGEIQTKLQTGCCIVGGDLGAPMDVLWMRLSRRPSDPGQTFGHAAPAKDWCKTK
jgi:hypothetical protein